ncbi:hypothetical protein MMC18_009591 [Xylographa bjoerkii]|nr:hypothetical protein [Xylographa bjoerkii]
MTSSSSHGGPIPLTSAAQQILPLRQVTKDLWRKAFNSLRPEDQLPIDQTLPSRIVVLNEVLSKVEEKKQQCLQNRWTYKNGKGEAVILRDVFDKIAVWIDKFKAVGDTVVQYDTAHAALPGQLFDSSFRYNNCTGSPPYLKLMSNLDQASVNDSQTFGAMAEGVELLSNLITHYTIVECLYLRKPSMAKSQLTQALLEVYSAVLVYLSKANQFYERSTPGRIAMSVIKTPEKTVTRYLSMIIQTQINVDALLNRGLMKLDTAQEKLKDILTELNRPICRMADQLSDLHDSLEGKFGRAPRLITTS